MDKKHSSIYKIISAFVILSYNKLGYNELSQANGFYTVKLGYILLGYNQLVYNNSVITNSVIKNSVKTNSVVTNYIITNSVITNSVIINSVMTNLVITNSVIANSSFQQTLKQCLFGPSGLFPVYNKVNHGFGQVRLGQVIQVIKNRKPFTKPPTQAHVGLKIMQKCQVGWNIPLFLMSLLNRVAALFHSS